MALKAKKWYNISMKTLSTNKLASHPAYAKIMHQYNECLIRDSRVNSKKFYEEMILPEIPSYKIQSWYKFLRRFKTTAGLIAAQVVNGGPNTIKNSGENDLLNNMASNEVATQLGMRRALNIGADRLKEIFDNPQLMTAKDAAELFFKAMRAQDSRINAISKIRKDTREEEKFQRAFDEAAYGHNGD